MVAVLPVGRASERLSPSLMTSLDGMMTDANSVHVSNGNVTHDPTAAAAAAAETPGTLFDNVVFDGLETHGGSIHVVGGGAVSILPLGCGDNHDALTNEKAKYQGEITFNECIFFNNKIRHQHAGYVLNLQYCR